MNTSNVWTLRADGIVAWLRHSSTSYGRDETLHLSMFALPLTPRRNVFISGRGQGDRAAQYNFPSLSPRFPYIFINGQVSLKLPREIYFLVPSSNWAVKYSTHGSN